MRPQRKKNRRGKSGGVNQTKCWIATEGHIWMEGYFDTLPLSIRRRLRDSQFNLCPACLVTEFLPKVRLRHSGYSRVQALFAAIEVMESQLRKGNVEATS
jgi:hypothetical protein